MKREVRAQYVLSMISSAVGFPKHIMNYAFTERSAKSNEACSRMQKVIDSGGLI